jgi:chromosome segregation ATPase
MKNRMVISLVVILWLPIVLAAGEIYTWKDQDGVQQFSNAPPPEHIKDYQTIESTVAGEQSADTGNRRRPSYDEMVERTSKAADASREKREKEAAAKAAEKRRIIEKEEKARIDHERKKLEAQIEALKKRAVSPTFPNGMKQARIEALRKKIKALEKGAGTSGQKRGDAGKASE